MSDERDPNVVSLPTRPHDNDQKLVGVAGGPLAEMDQEAFTNMRAWLRKAVEEAGAECTGSGIGFGALDLDIELDGFKYSITMKPLPAPGAPT